jgi:hypothetical protein
MTTELVIARTVAETEINGIEMGVLEDGTSYLTVRGLARACGITHPALVKAFTAWSEGKRTSKFAQAIVEKFDGDSLVIPLASNKHAVTDAICILVLGYYAEQQSVLAIRHLLAFAAKGLRRYIYEKTGYDPDRSLPNGWQSLYDRLSQIRLPSGHFCVVREMIDFLYKIVKAGLHVDKNTVPDISVGLLWAKHWIKCKLEEEHGKRIKEGEHWYPDTDPQSRMNPHLIWCYPNSALGIYRDWLEKVYIPTHFTNYLEDKVEKALAAQLLAAVVSPVLSDGGDDDDDE